MLASCHGRRPPAAVERQTRVAAALALVPFITTGCTPGAGDAAPWVFAALALVVAAGLGYALGALRTRMSGDTALRDARKQVRQLTRLHEGWLWQTDEAHRVLSWQPAGRPADTQCALFDMPELQAQLQAQQPFSSLRVRAAVPHEGSMAWELSATPKHDELGRFVGFFGSARPLDAQDTLQVAASALAPALQLRDSAALLIAASDNGWRVHQFNTAAATAWPPLAPGVDLVDATGPLPPALLAALLAGTGGDVAGWRLIPVPMTTGAQAWLLARPGVVADTTAQNSESDSFSFTVSHDLRAPIRVVEGFTRIVKEDYGRLLDRVGNDHLDRVLGAAARMNLMIDALLTLARLSSQPLARQPVNLSQLAGYVIDDLKRAAPEREADVQIEAALLTQGDPTLLRLVLENLLGNAWKYSARSPRAQISLSATMHAGRKTYVVRDNGAGFDMRSADRLFGLFQRLHSASEFAGHGVGLASVRRIVRRHGGDIWAEAEPSRGAAFYFTLRD